MKVFRADKGIVVFAFNASMPQDQKKKSLNILKHVFYVKKKNQQANA